MTHSTTTGGLNTRLPPMQTQFDTCIRLLRSSGLARGQETKKLLSLVLTVNLCPGNIPDRKERSLASVGSQWCSWVHTIESALRYCEPSPLLFKGFSRDWFSRSLLSQSQFDMCA